MEAASNILFADIILPLPLNGTFTYHFLKEDEKSISIGKRVIVQFGKRKLYTGIVQTIHTNKPEYDTKPIETVLDESPIIHEIQLKLWDWLADYYSATVGEVMKAALPSGLKLESQSNITANLNWEASAKLSDIEETLLSFLKTENSATISKLNSVSKRRNIYPVVKSLISKGAISIEEKLSKKVKSKTKPYLSIHPKYKDGQLLEVLFSELKRANKQLELLMYLIDETNFLKQDEVSSLPKKKIIKSTKFTDANIKALVDKDVLILEQREVDRLDYQSNNLQEKKELNHFQQIAFNEIHKKFLEKNTVLLHGVTASGKTEIYIKLIDEQLKAGKQVLYLLPEIALTTQIISRLKKVFGEQAMVYHSRFSDAERIEIWNKVLHFNKDDSDNKCQLIVGARSSLFLPFSNLGLIIVDEEHETSYKQFDPAPRYNARDAAIVLGHLHAANTLLGTATPSFESYFNAKNGKYGMVELKTRHHEIELPEITFASLTDAYKRKSMLANFTPILYEAVENALQNNEQVILFQNRRGFSPFIQCKNCGWIPKCKHCDVSLTYHKFANNLQCHYCGYSQQMPNHCDECNSTDVQTKGFGTEKIEDDLKLFFPDAKVERLDMDAAKRKHGFEGIIERFSEGETQILVGTQMITKGLDFENVSVVGILNADNLLNFPDFRSYERAYQLIAQVSGRAGRKHKQGKVIIQTTQPEHIVLSFVKNNDYETLFNSLIGERKLFKYPPYFRLINITLKHKNRDRAILASKQLASELRKTFGNRVLGPEFPLISRIQQYYHLTIRLKFEKNIAPTEAKSYLLNAIQKVKSMEQNTSIIVQIDVDPI